MAGLSVYAALATALLAKKYFSESGGGHTVVQEVEQESKQDKQLGGAFWITPPEVRVGCTNWRALLLNGENQVAGTAGECGRLCTADPNCMSFNYQQHECAGMLQNGEGACYLFSNLTSCEMEVNNCWDLYHMRRSTQSVCFPEEVMRGDDAGMPLMTLQDNLGPLLGLLGKWSNAPLGWNKDSETPTVKGLNVVRLPLQKPEGVPLPQTADFEQDIQEYVEVLEFSPIMGAVRNRGYENANQFSPECQLDQFVIGLSYLQVIFNISDGVVLHDESGQWLFNQDPGIFNGWTVARMGVIPHGQAIQAVGRNSTIVGSENIKNDIRATMSPNPFGFDPGPGPYFTTRPLLPPDDRETGAGYADAPAPFNDTQSLVDQVPEAAEGEVKATKLDITTSAAMGGSIGQLPNPKAQAFTEQFNFTFWIEEWLEADPEDPEKVKKTMQLQYLQTMFLTFMSASAFNVPNCDNNGLELDCLIKWPHYDMNTLFKIADYPFESMSSLHPMELGGALAPIR